MSSVTLLVVTTSAWDPVTNVGTTPKRPMFPNDDRFTSPCRWRKTDKMMSYFSSIRETSNHGFVDTIVEGSRISKINETHITEFYPLPALVCNEPTVKGVRFGPIKSVPRQFHYFYDGPGPYNGFDLNFLFNGDELITGSLLGVLDPSGLLIGLPPLHLHHIHVHKHNLPPEGVPGKDPAVEDNFHFFAAHGDYSHGNDWGAGARSAERYVQKVPEGYGVHVGSTVKKPPGQSVPITGYATIDDERYPTGEDLPELTFYLEFSFEIGTPSTKVASKILLHNPLHPRHNAWAGVPYAYPVRNVPEVAWWSSFMTASGTMLHEGMYTHLHRVRLSKYGLVLLRASLADIGFNEQTCHDRFGIQQPDGEIALVDNLTHTYQAFARLPQVVCKHNWHVPEGRFFVEVPGNASQGLLPNARFDRQGVFDCKPWSFKKGDPWTMVAHFSPNWDVDYPIMPMHTFLSFFFIPDSEADVGDWQLFAKRFNPGCGENPQGEAWNDLFNILHSYEKAEQVRALSAGGGLANFALYALALSTLVLALSALTSRAPAQEPQLL